MVTDALLALLQALWSALLGTIPTPGDASWVNSVGDGIAWLTVTLGSLGSWLPFGIIAGVVGSLMAAWLIAGGIVIVRMAVSLFTGGGGNVTVGG